MKTNTTLSHKARSTAKKRFPKTKPPNLLYRLRTEPSDGLSDSAKSVLAQLDEKAKEMFGRVYWGLKDKERLEVHVAMTAAPPPQKAFDAARRGK